MSLRLAPKPLDIDPLDGFSKSDIFKAAETGERLANIVSDLDGHSVIVLDGPWGTGKSVFVQQWAGLLRTRGHPVVYFDAFAHDHLDDAFFPLFAQLLRATASAGPALDRFRRALIGKAMPLVRSIPTLLTDLAVRVGTGGILTGKDVRETLEQSRDGDAARAMMEERLNLVETHRESVGAFRTELERAVSEMDEDDGKPPLIFIIDELDRCRPTYALSVLERMKHVFDANGVCFVLVTHLTELTAMVRRAYGLIDADSYLEKFYHRRFDFTKLLMRGSDRLRRRYLDHLASGMNLPRESTDYTTITINNLIRLYDISLRGQEQIMLNLSLFHSAASGRIGDVAVPTQENLCRFILGAGLCVMRYVKPQLFQAASMTRLKFSDTQSFLNLDQWTEISSDGIGMVEYWWKAATVDGVEYMTEQEKVGPDPRQKLRWGKSRLVDICSDIELFWE